MEGVDFSLLASSAVARVVLPSACLSPRRAQEVLGEAREREARLRGALRVRSTVPLPSSAGDGGGEGEGTNRGGGGGGGATGSSSCDGSIGVVGGGKAAVVCVGRGWDEGGYALVVVGEGGEALGVARGTPDTFLLSRDLRPRGVAVCPVTGDVAVVLSPSPSSSSFGAVPRIAVVSGLLKALSGGVGGGGA